MGRRVAGWIAVVLAVVVARVLWTREGPTYVGLPTQVMLVVAVPVLAGMGLWAALGRDGVQAHDDHRHAGSVWLLLAVIPALFGVVAPQPLGSYVVQNQQNRPTAVPTAHATTSFPPLSSDPAPMSVEEYWRRSTEGGGATVQGRSVTLIGFAGPTEKGMSSDWTVSRLRVWCCAADALPFVIGVHGGQRPADGQWVEVTGTYLPPDASRNAYVALTSVRAIEQPEDPYLR